MSENKIDNSKQEAFGFGYFNANDGSEVYSKGITKREYFAGLAMQGMLSSMKGYTNSGVENLASIAVQQADALLAELEKEI